ncbi:MAG: PKD domain-containing protein [Gammaproteobacteria bacterium]
MPAITLLQFAGRPGDIIAMSASSTDPQNAALAYSWVFGDGATAAGASVSHTYSTEGQFVPRVTVSNEFGLSASATTGGPISIAYLPLPHFLIFETNLEHFLGQTLVLQTSNVAMDQNGLALTYQWSFGDGSTATGAEASHVYAAAGSYAVTLTVTNSANHSSTAQATSRVFAPIAQPAAIDNVFAPYCAGAFCGASSATAYGGTGTGVWRYHNSTASNATVDIDIQGVHEGQYASLVFTNGTPADAATLPGAGSLVSMSAPVAPLNVPDRQTLRLAGEPLPGSLSGSSDLDSDSAHEAMLLRNLASAREFIRAHVPGVTPASPEPRVRTLAATAPPALGTKRVWNETFGGNVPYNMEVAATCGLSTGRNAVFWIDSAQVASGSITRARVQFLVDELCQPDSGAYARQVALTGDVWGPAAAGSGYIEDAPGALQDLHIVMPGVPASASWGGYFSSGNLAPAANNTSTNAALAIFVNANLLTRSATDPSAGATLIHELKHHINFYQRTVARHAFHPIWLEESSAMLSEDLFTEPLLGYNRAELRHDGYVFSGGGIGYLGWTDPEGNSYNQGGSFGAFLHRKYGLDVDRRLVDTCVDDGTPASGYQCLDSLILQWGGRGFADEFSRHGASVFGGMGKGSVPYGFGFPAVAKEGVFLDVFASSSVIYPPSKITPRAITQFLATMHAYQLDQVAAGQTVYERHGVVVPAGTTLMLVIQ